MLVERIRNTNVVCSYLSGSLDAALIDYLVSEEMDAIRLIADSTELKEILEFAKNLRQAYPSTKAPVPILLDVLSKSQGTVYGLQQPKEVSFGEKLRLGRVGSKADLQLETSDLASLFALNTQVFCGFGYVSFKVLSCSDDSVELECTQGGTIQPDMKVYVPGTQKLSRQSDISDLDLEQLVSYKIDYLVLPDFEEVDDFSILKRRLSKYKASAPWMILKVNSYSTYQKLKSILPFVRGVLVSRLEMAMTTDPAFVPMLTKEIIQTCNDQAKVVLVASEMLASMHYNATPTRAEISDIANAVMDGADGVILSEDLPSGAFAKRGLLIAKKAIEDIEQASIGRALNWIKHQPSIGNELAAITYTAYRTAQRNRAKALVCITKTGNTALHLASFRQGIPIVAVTLSPDVQRRLSIIRGVSSFYLEQMPGIDDVLPIINERLVNESWLKRGDKVVFVSVSISSVGQEASNLFVVQTLY